MNKNTSLVTTILPAILASTLSPETRGLITLGRSYGWDFAVLGCAPLPENPVRAGDWLIVPAHQDTSPLPSRTLDRIEKIYASGFRPKGFVIVHEAPLLLPAHLQEDTGEFRMTTFPPQYNNLMKVLTGAVLGLTAGLVFLSGILLLALIAIGVLAALVAPLVLVAGAVVLDPILIAVTQDGYWVEIDRWWS